MNLINDVGFDAGPDEFYHDYAIVDVAHADRHIEGLRFVFIELPKFKPKTIAERKMAVLWLRFLTEINSSTKEAPAELLDNPDTAKALKLLEKSAYNEGQLEAYDRFWDAVYRERVFYNDGFKKGQAEGIEETNRKNARKMKAKGFATEDIAEITGLTAEEIDRL